MQNAKLVGVHCDWQAFHFEESASSFCGDDSSLHILWDTYIYEGMCYFIQTVKDKCKMAAVCSVSMADYG